MNNIKMAEKEIDEVKFCGNMVRSKNTQVMDRGCESITEMINNKVIESIPPDYNDFMDNLKAMLMGKK